MIRTLSLILMFFIGTACNKEEIASYNDLTDAERAAIQSHSHTECLANSNTHFTEFTTGSDDSFYGSSAYAVGTTFNHSFTEKSGTTTTTRYTHKITVWKVTTTDIYLLIDIDDTTDEYRFLKIPKTTNDAMITDLQSKYCERGASRDTTFTLSTSSKTYTKITTGTSKEITYTHTYDLAQLAFFSKYKETRKEQALDTNGNASGASVTYTGTLSGSTTETNIPKYDTYAEYVATGVLTTLCLVNYSIIPYSMTCDQTGATTFLSTEL